jgi:hypothetical protein
MLLNTPERVTTFLETAVDKTGNCWLWRGRRSGNGYGQIGIARKSHLAHRFMWQLLKGPIPPGLHVLHKCDTPACVNPDHLFLGTAKDNSDDKWAKGRDGTVRGELAGMSKLTDNLVRWIHYLRSLGATQLRIGEIVGCSTRNVGSVLAGITWRHVV